MHEFLLFGQVANDDRHKLLQQLAGVTRMQPLHVVERHLIFKARPPLGLSHIPSGGGSQGVLPQEVQKVKQWLLSSIFYLQLVYSARSGRAKVRGTSVLQSGLENGNNSEGRSTVQAESSDSTQRQDGVWTIEFRDIPEAGKQPVTARLLGRTPTEDGDLIQFVKDLGYEYGCDAPFFRRGKVFNIILATFLSMFSKDINSTTKTRPFSSTKCCKCHKLLMTRPSQPTRPFRPLPISKPSTAVRALSSRLLSRLSTVTILKSRKRQYNSCWL